ncbi:MAG: hypothetical protein SP4CHLAM5_10800 [Chlamydiia bacterium]|nr:hypothetical protein [Chlamydiia bacterium]MCH9618937.1 hypothetical protein [Chlamydiia bacterium]MCH9624753.1 hypothetical protein [Chlamydiia bacterium]
MTVKRYIFIFLALFLFSGGAFFIKSIAFFEDVPISKICQISLQKEALSSLYLTELLDLSYDKKTFRDDLDIESCQKKLVSSPLITDATLSFIDNGHIKVEYRHVTPIARLGDFLNCGIDKEGRLFPLKPFFSKQGLPKVYLGIHQIEKEKNMESYQEKSKWIFARNFLMYLEGLDISGKIISIDVSKISEKSLGKNEIIVVIEYLDRKDYLRLSKRNYLNEVTNYIILCDKLKDESGTYMIDFRFESCAFLEKF